MSPPFEERREAIYITHITMPTGTGHTVGGHNSFHERNKEYSFTDISLLYVRSVPGGAKKKRDTNG